jgi:hypothetical protein
MKNKRPHQILIVLFLIFNVFINSAMTAAYFCGKACLHELAYVNDKSIFHMHCSSTECKGCELENGQSTRAINNNRTHNSKVFKSTFIYAALPIQHLTSNTISNFNPFSASGARRSSPIYLNNLTLII